MTSGLKQRLIGAAVLIALAVIFLPMLVKGPAPASGLPDMPLELPEAPDGQYKTVDLPLVAPAPAREGGVLADGASRAAAPVATTAPAGGEALPTVETGAQAEPLPPTTAGGGYAVHYGAFANEADAEAILRQLGQSSLTGYRESFTLNGRPAQRVRLGPYASRAEAEIVRLRAAQVRDDVSPRVVALDAAAVPAAAPAPAPRAPAATPPAEPARTAQTPPPAAAPAAPPAPAATPAPTPAPAPAAPTSGVGFVVQLGAFSNAADAERLRDRLRAAGVTAFTDGVTTDKGRLTRVKAGPVASRGEADQLKAQVRAKVGIDGLVRPHP